MNVPLLSASRVERIGWLLIHSLWQFALIALVVVILLRILRRSSAAVRYGVCLTGLLAVALAPAVTWMLLPAAAPASSDVADHDPPAVPVVAGPLAATDATLAGGDIAADRTDVGDASTDAMPDGDASTIAAGSPSSAASAGSPSLEAAATGTAATWSMQIRRHVAPWLNQLVTLWCLGVLLFALRPVGSWYLVHRLRSVGVSPVSQPVIAAFDRAVQRMGVRRPVCVLGSTLARVPMVVGYIRPVILLPLCVVSGLSSKEVEAILAHELAHIRRHDYLVNLLQTLTETVCFYHPAVWWLSSRIRQEREHCCDDLAVRALGNRTTYGRALLALEELRAETPVLSLSATDGSLLHRIRRLTGVEQSPPEVNGGTAVAFLAAFTLLSIGLCWTDAPSAQSADDNEVEASAIAFEIEHPDPRMAEIIRAVIEQEQRYRHLEYVEQLESYFRSDHPRGAGTVSFTESTPSPAVDPPAPIEISPRIVESSHVTLHGDLIAFEQDRTSHLHDGKEHTHRRESAFNGVRTVSVEYGNSVNIHPNRYEASQVFPPHVWSLRPVHVNFPLSVYLHGGPPLETHPKVRRSPNSFFGLFECLATESQRLSSELVGDLLCEKIRVLHHSSRDGKPAIHHLWLAPERNYLCVKLQGILERDGKERLWCEATVDELREVSAGLWLPAAITTITYGQPRDDGTPVPRTRTTLRLERATAGGSHPKESFEVAIPSELPLFAIGTDGRLTDSPHHPAPAQEKSGATLAEIVAAVEQNEQLYRSIDVTVASEYIHLNSIYHAATGSMGTPTIHRKTRTALIPDQKYWLREQHTLQPDGTWSKDRNSAQGKLNGNDVYLPHSWYLHRYDTHLSRNLRGDSDHAVVYEGDDLIDGLLCHRLSRTHRRGEGAPISKQVIWICPQRNHIPVRTEYFHLARSEKLPSGVHVVEEFRQIEPDVWFPVRWTDITCHATDGTGLPEHRMIVNWRKDNRVTHLSLNPQIDVEAPEVVLQSSIEPTGGVLAASETSDVDRADDDRPGDVQPPGVVSGLLVNAADGSPVSGAKVTLRGSKAYYAESDEAGRFRFEEIPPATRPYQIWARAGNLVTTIEQVEQTAADDGKSARFAPQRLEMTPGHQVRFTITSIATGEPLAGADVKIGYPHRQTVTSGANGVALVEGLLPREYDIAIEAVGFARAATQLNLSRAPALTEQSVRLDAGGVIRGTVIDKQGEPIPEATVSYRDPQTSVGFYGDNPRTAADGRFQNRFLPLNAPVEVSVRAEGYLPQKQNVTILPTEREADVTVTLKRRPPGGSIAGVVQDADGRPIPGVRVANYGRTSSPHVKTTTGADGSFVLHDLAKSYTGHLIHLTADGYAPQRVDVEPGTPAAPGKVTVTLQPGHSIRGQVVDEHSRPLKNVYISPRSPAFGFGFGPLVTTSGDGRFAFDSLPADVLFDFNHEDYPGLRGKEYELDSDEPMTIRFDPPGVIRGRVIDAETGKAVPQFRVRIGFRIDRRPGDAKGTYDSRWNSPGLAFDAQDGRFVIQPLTSGFAAELEVLAESYERTLVARAVAAPMVESEELTIRLKPAATVDPFTLSGQLLDHAGRPAAGAQLRLIVSKAPPASAEDNRYNWLLVKNGQLASKSYVEQFLSGVTDANGRFEFENIIPGAFLQLAYWGEGVPQDRSLAFDRTKAGQHESVTIELPEPATIRGTIERANFPDAGSITLTREHAAWHRYEIELTDKQSSFEFKDLPPGEYGIHVAARPVEHIEDGNTFYRVSTIAAQKVELEAGESREVTFTERDKPR